MTRDCRVLFLDILNLVGWDKVEIDRQCLSYLVNVGIVENKNKWIFNEIKFYNLQLPLHVNSKTDIT